MLFYGKGLPPGLECRVVGRPGRGYSALLSARGAKRNQRWKFVTIAA
jgi:hypothetical protein